MKLKQITEAKYKGHMKYDDPRKTIKNALIDAIVNRKPSDLTSGHGMDWFFINSTGRVVWNWENKNYPAKLIADELGIEDITPQSRAYITNQVLRSKPIKQYKQKLLDKSTQSGEILYKYKNVLTNIDQDIANLKRRRKDILAKIKKLT